MPDISDSILGFCFSVMLGAGFAEADMVYVAGGFWVLALFSLFLLFLAYLNDGDKDEF